mmetsp:Transcript_17699/g.33564  ORF Transcript_17699/g.33564 Transcript_17699/m.33564 type:complete len:85 (+) Transcript_17699:477-731(+)
MLMIDNLEPIEYVWKKVWDTQRRDGCKEWYPVVSENYTGTMISTSRQDYRKRDGRQTRFPEMMDTRKKRRERDRITKEEDPILF